MPEAARTEVEGLPFRLDVQTVEGLAARLTAMRGRDLDLDASGVEHVDSHGVRFLMEAFSIWTADGRRLRVINPSPVVADVLLCLDLGGAAIL